MLKKTTLAAGALALLAALTIPAANAAAPVPLTATLKGVEEVPGPGDANGRGELLATVKRKRGKFCFTLSWKRIEGPTAAHIHRGRDGVAGPVRIELFAVSEPLPNPGSVEGCVNARKRKLRRIARHPERFYANVHNAAYPDGAIRGQLEPDS